LAACIELYYYKSRGRSLLSTIIMLLLLLFLL